MAAMRVGFPAGRQPPALAKAELGSVAIGPIAYTGQEGGAGRERRLSLVPRREGVGPSLLVVMRNRVILK